METRNSPDFGGGMRQGLIALGAVLGVLLGASEVLAVPSDKIRNQEHPWQFESRDWAEGQPQNTKFMRAYQCMCDLVELTAWTSNNPRMLIRRGACGVLLERTEFAIEEFKFLLEMEPEEPRSRKMLAIAYNSHAYRLYRNRMRLSEALVVIDRAIALEPTESIYLSTKAEVLYAMGRPAEALVLIRRSLQDYPDHAELLHDLANIETALAASNQN